ncbi:hypothetical protein GINT2_001979 [Glugoides intestinalis]
MEESANKYRDPEYLSDSDEEIHPNIDTKSYRKFIKEQRAVRHEQLKRKENLSSEERKELQDLEYKLLPVDKDVSEDSFRTSKEETENIDYSNDLMILVNNNTVEFFLSYMDKRIINLEEFEDLIYINLSEAIKEGNDDVGIEFCKLGMLTKWTKMFGKSYLERLNGLDEQIQEIVNGHYKASKEAILSLNKDA